MSGRIRHARRIAVGVVAVCFAVVGPLSACARNGRAGAAIVVPKHIETWAFDDGCNGGAGAGARFVRAWLSYAESNCATNAPKARRDCHARGVRYCDVMQYYDTNWDFPGHAAGIASARSFGWWLHEPAPQQNSRIYSSTFGGGYAINQSDPAVRSFFRRYALRHYNADDGLLMDWQSPSLAQELYASTCGCRTTNEIRSDVALRAAHAAMSAALTHRNGAPFIQVDNSLPPNPFLPQGLDMLNPSAGVDGWSAEGEPEDGGTLAPYYSTLLDQIAYVTTRTTGFVVLLSRANSGATYLDQSRRVQESTMLLGYKPGQLVDWADLEQNSPRLAVWPEEGIYPTNPVQSMGSPGGPGCLAGGGHVCSTGGHNDVGVGSGVYRRVFQDCYLRGVSFGPCAAIVNTGASAVTVRGSWLAPWAFRHQITFSGGDVQSGGRLHLHGAGFTAGRTVVGARDALLLSS